MPAWLAIVLARVRALFTKASLDDDFDAEMQAHLDMLADEHERRGLSPEAARRAALLRFGGPMQIKEQQRDGRCIPGVESTLKDVRYALRSFRKHPAFSLTAVATLAIGIGSGTAVFTFVRAVLLRPLPYRDPNALVRIYETNPLRGWTRNGVALANWKDWRERNRSFVDIGAYEQFTTSGSGASDLSLTGTGDPQAVKAIAVTGNLFDVLGAQPLMGRAFREEETYEGRNRVVILGYALWRSAFGGDANILGRTITLSARQFEVVGVMPRTFFFPGRDVHLWTPVGYSPQLIAQSRRPHWMGAVARLRPGVGLEPARADMNGIAKQLESQYPDTNTQMGVRLDLLHDSFASDQRTSLLMLSGAVALLFLIVCVNVANLQLGRVATRTRELAIRRALGAGRARLIRQLLTEGLVLSAIGGSIGVVIAVATQEALTRYAASAVPLFADVHIDRSVLLFALGLSLAAPVLFGVIPALTSAGATLVTQRTESPGRDTASIRHLLIASEVALSIVLVVGAVLLARSLSRLAEVDPGFDQAHAVSFRLALPSARYADAAARFKAFTDIERRLRDQPGIQSVGATSTLALRGFTWSGDTTIEGRAPTDYERDTRHASTTREYFAAMGIRLLAGRFFADTDTRDKPQVTIVNDMLAKRYFRGLPNDQVVGKRIAFGRPQDNSNWVEIVGVVDDTKQDGLDQPADPIAYSSIVQRQQNPLTFVVRSGLDPQTAITTARRGVSEVDRDLALTDVTTLEDLVDGAMEGFRFRTALLLSVAAVALLLAALGIYGVLAYFVSQRSRELSIRLALGARPAELFGLVVRQGLGPVTAGAVVGIAAALALTGLMRSLLFGVEPIDGPTYAVAIAALGLLSLAACALPAQRATRVDPLVALRDE